MLHDVVPTGYFWTDFFAVCGILIPNITAVVLGLIGYWKSVDNNNAIIHLRREIHASNGGHDVPILPIEKLR